MADPLTMRKPLSKEGLKEAILDKLVYSVGKDPQHATRRVVGPLELRRDHPYFMAAPTERLLIRAHAARDPAHMRQVRIREHHDSHDVPRLNTMPATPSPAV